MHCCLEWKVSNQSKCLHCLSVVVDMTPVFVINALCISVSDQTIQSWSLSFTINRKYNKNIYFYEKVHSLAAIWIWQPLNTLHYWYFIQFFCLIQGRYSGFGIMCKAFFFHLVVRSTVIPNHRESTSNYKVTEEKQDI